LFVTHEHQDAEVEPVVYNLSFFSFVTSISLLFSSFLIFY
jgi:hypothetical protein